MPKGHTAVAELVRQFETHCRLERKPETTCRWYRGILDKFLEWTGDVCLDDFTLEKVRGYLGFLKNRPRDPTPRRRASLETATARRRSRARPSWPTRRESQPSPHRPG